MAVRPCEARTEETEKLEAALVEAAFFLEATASKCSFS
jgi:hypothetical protein